MDPLDRIEAILARSLERAPLNSAEEREIEEAIIALSELRTAPVLMAQASALVN
jgi:hypothetical protein